MKYICKIAQNLLKNQKEKLNIKLYSEVDGITGPNSSSLSSSIPYLGLPVGSVPPSLGSRLDHVT